MTREEFQVLAGKRYDQLQALNKFDNFYDYEHEFAIIMQEMGKEILEKNLGDLPVDRRKKKTTLTQFGEIEIANKHLFSKGMNGFQISSLLQEKIVFVGQMDCYENCSEVLKKLTGIQLGPTQIYRVTDLYGKGIEKLVDTERTLTPLKTNEVLYAEMDGSMILTRKEGWKEVKVGRFFKSSDCIHAGSKPGWISNSQYVAQLGNSVDFTKTMDDLIESYGKLGKRLIFISDGAVWIKNWITDAFPNAVTILDYYHACEHLHQFSNRFFKDKEIEKKWATDQKELLLNGCVTEVIKNIKAIAKNNEADELIAYYEGNKDRMDYKKYKTTGCGIIGSGAIESAHRTVIQKRMKLSGQRWGKEGAQNMLNLRVINKNQQWGKIIEMSKFGFRATG